MTQTANSGATAFVVIAEFQVKEGALDSFLAAAIDDATHSVRDEPGCLQFDVNCGIDCPNRVTFYEVYQSREAFDAHLQTPHLLRFQAAFPDLIETELPVRFLNRSHPRTGA